MARSSRWWLPLALAAVVGVGAPALASSFRGVFIGDEWRYDRAHLIDGLALRILADLVAIPSGAATWSAGDWLSITALAGSAAALSVGDPSLDLRFHAFVQQEVLGGPQHFRAWQPASDVIIWASLITGTLTVALHGLVDRDGPALEAATLIIEAVAASQAYHVLLKLMTGRVGPNTEGFHEGAYLGFPASLRLFPGGTPSGHMATFSALISVVTHFIDAPWVTVLGAGLMVVFGASLIGDEYHWLSDVVLGGALGFSVGRWVVRHRSTRFATPATGCPSASS